MHNQINHKLEEINLLKKDIIKIQKNLSNKEKILKNLQKDLESICEHNFDETDKCKVCDYYNKNSNWNDYCW